MEDLTKQRKRQFVAYNVLYNRIVSIFIEAMSVFPEFVWATHLLVHEFNRWLPAGDTCLPAQRKPHQAEPVVDQSTFTHLDGLGSEDTEVEFRRGDAL